MHSVEVVDQDTLFVVLLEEQLFTLQIGRHKLNYQVSLAAGESILFLVQHRVRFDRLRPDQRRLLLSRLLVPLLVVLRLAVVGLRWWDKVSCRPID